MTENTEERTMIQHCQELLTMHENSYNELANEVKKLKKDLKKTETKLHYSPDDEDLKTERSAIIDTLSDKESDLEDRLWAYQQAQKELRQAQIDEERERLLNESEGIKFIVPDENPVLACQMLAAIADRLQYQFCSSQGYYEYLLGQVYGKQAGIEGINKGSDDDPSPEIGRDDLDRLDQLRNERELITKYRFAVERDFNEMVDQLPANTTYRPQLLRRSDQEVINSIERSRENRLAQQQEQRQKAKESAKDFSQIETQVYKPGVATG